MSVLEAVRYVLLTLTGIGMTFVLADRRYSLKKTLIIMGGGALGIIAVNLFIGMADARLFVTIYPLTTNGLALLLLFFVSKRRGFPLLFNMLTAISLCAVAALPGIWITQMMGVPVWAEIVLRLVIAVPLILLLYRYFRPSYLVMLQIMRRGWGYFCLMPLSFYVLFYLEFMHKANTDYSEPLLVVFLVLLIVMAAYGVIFAFFRKMVKEMESRNERQLLKSQIQAMEQQAGMIRQSNEQVRIYRHDMRHFAAEVTTLLKAGDTAEALKVLGDFDELNQKTVLPDYCDNPTVNAILAYYLKQAQDAGIRVETECYVPVELPVGAAELAMVLANALENAIHACEKLPEEREKKIAVRILHTPHLVLEVANTYDGEARFDSEGLPVARESGHGIGTRSILAFVEKYGAVIDYQADETLFRLRLLVDNS